MNGNVTSRDGASIAWWRSGQGTPLVLVHGTTADHTEWMMAAPVLEQSFSVYTFDRRGRSESTDGDGYSLGREVEDLVALVGGIEGRVALLGHSYGGIVALAAAPLLAEKLSHLILYEPPIDRPIAPGQLQRLDDLLAANRREELIEEFALNVGRVPPAELEFVKSMESEWEGMVARAATVPREMREVDRFALDADRLADVGVPVLLLQGADSHPDLVIGNAAVKAALPASRSALFAGQQHLAHVFAPDLFAAEVLRFVGAEGERGATEKPQQKEAAMTTQEQEQTRAAWDAIAAGYDEFVTPKNLALAEDALRLAGLRSGMRLLDVASGSGALSIPAARLGAEVLATDIAPVMVERLEARAREEGLSNLEARVMDGHALELEKGTFDISGSQFGVMLFPDLKRGLSEMTRVTRPGGCVLMVAFGPPTELEFLGFFMGAIQAVVPGFTGLPMDPPPLPFQVADPEVLRQRLAEAGLTDIRVERVNYGMEFRSGQHMWDSVTNSNPIGAMLVAGLTEEQRAAVRQALDGMLRERAAGSGPAVLTNPINIGIGSKR